MKLQNMNDDNFLGVFLTIFIIVLVFHTPVFAHSTTPAHTRPPTPKPDYYNCSTHSDSCDSCVKNSVHCYYCYSTKKCGVYPFGSLQPIPDECGDSLSDLSWKTCTVRANVLVIVFATLGALLGLIIFIFISWCCCIRPCVRKCREKQNAKWERNRLRLQEMQSTRRKERQQQRDAIRAKYGLDGPAYDKF